jgi:hypothetical protein
MSTATVCDFGQVQGAVIRRALRDTSFRRRLRADPRAALEQELARLGGAPVRLPEGLSVRVVEEAPASLVLVLPAPPPAAGADDLDPADLDYGAENAFTYERTNCGTCFVNGCRA